MLVVGLCFAVASLRRVGAVEQLVPATGWLLPVLSCVLVGLSSAALWRKRGGLALGLAAAFVASQSALVWRAAAIEGQGQDVVWLLAGFHLVHLVVGMGGIATRTLGGRPSGGWQTYWHALALAWLAMSGVLFL